MEDLTRVVGAQHRQQPVRIRSTNRVVRQSAVGLCPIELVVVGTEGELAEDIGSEELLSALVLLDLGPTRGAQLEDTTLGRGSLAGRPTVRCRASRSWR